MIDELILNGEWWIPDKSEKKITGTLNFSPNDEISLDLLGSFDGTEVTSFEIILGLTIEGKKITLTGLLPHL